jgi:cytochrome d ubiquinol oxidase subunit I
MDVELLARLQFGLTIAFHYIFPPLSIGLGLMLVIMEACWLWTREQRFLRLAKFWMSLFGLIFAVGVATGIVMEFQFGTNWSNYSRYVGDVFGSALAAEGIFAFFMESGFLAIALFGWELVRPGWHFFATCMVGFGAHFSAVWIVVANSWQQTPAGYHLVAHGGEIRAEVTDFWAVVFNPSSVDRIVHTILGAWLAGAFFVLSVSAFYLLRNRHRESARPAMKIALVVAALASLLQLASGDRSARIVTEHQPAKLAAMEGLFETTSHAPLHLFGWVDADRRRVVGPAIPAALSLLAHRDVAAEVIGLDRFPRSDWPPVGATFQCFHLMVALGMAMIAISWLGILLWWRRRLFDPSGRLVRLYLGGLVIAVLLPEAANEAGWFTAELGRQPWVVYGLMRTSQGVSNVVGREQVLFSIALFSAIYALLLALFVFLLDRKIRHGLEEEPAERSAKRFVPGEESQS